VTEHHAVQRKPEQPFTAEQLADIVKRQLASVQGLATCLTCRNAAGVQLEPRPQEKTAVKVLADKLKDHAFLKKAPPQGKLTSVAY